MKTVGIFGGSFNPPHLGHTALASAVVEAGLADEVWMVLSPLNPLKEAPAELVADSHRWRMLQLAVEGKPGLKACDVELSMPRPSYTAATMRRLTELYPDVRFRLVIGQDNWEIFSSWRESDTLRRLYAPIVYRRGADAPPVTGADTLSGAPLLPVSSTDVRRAVAAGLPVNNMVAPEVYRYIIEHKLYKR